MDRQIYIYIYLERDRERGGGVDIQIDIFILTYLLADLVNYISSLVSNFLEDMCNKTRHSHCVHFCSGTTGKVQCQTRQRRL
jgi:hypothetical protein